MLSLFDVCSILMYGSEIWNVHKVNSTTFVNCATCIRNVLINLVDE